MIDHSLVTGFTMFIRRSFDMTCFGISTYHRHGPPLPAGHDSGELASAGEAAGQAVRPIDASGFNRVWVEGSGVGRVEVGKRDLTGLVGAGIRGK